MSEPRRAILRSAAPGAFVAVAALGGQWVASLASLALLASPLAHVGLLVLLGQLASRLWRRRSLAAPLVGLGAVVCAELSLAALLFGVPGWVKARAAPAIAALEQWKQAHGRYPSVDISDGTFPEPLRTSLYAAECPSYAPAGSGFELTCRGVAFAKCTYVATAASWRGWD